MSDKNVYFLIFCNRISKWNFFLKRGFRHILIAIFVDDHLIFFERTLVGTLIKVKKVNDRKELIHELFAIRNFTRLEMIKKVSPTVKKRGFYLNWGTCVSMVKFFLNIPGWQLTPWQIFKTLRKENNLITLYKEGELYG